MINNWNDVKVMLDDILKDTQCTYHVNKKENIVSIQDHNSNVTTLYFDEGRMESALAFLINSEIECKLLDLIKNVKIRPEIK